MINGPLLPFPATPLIKILSPAPGAPDDDVTLTPAIVPCSACSVLMGRKSSNVFLPKRATAPVTSFFFFVPYPTTTTSSRFFCSDDSRITNSVFLDRITSVDSYPTKLTIKTLPTSKFANENEPLKSV